MKYLEGDIYTNNISQGFAEVIAYLVAGFMFTGLGIRLSFICQFGLSLLGMLALLIYQGDDQIWLRFFIMCSKFGIAAAFGCCYIGTQAIFPVEAVVFCFGMCAAIGHIASIVAPELAELDPPSIAKLSFIFSCAFAFVSIFFLREK